MRGKYKYIIWHLKKTQENNWCLIWKKTEIRTITWMVLLIIMVCRFFPAFPPWFIRDPFHNNEELSSKELEACLRKVNCILQISTGFAMIIFPRHCIDHCWVDHYAAHSSINSIWLVFIQFSKHYLYNYFPMYCFNLSQFLSLTKLWHWHSY